MLDEIMSQNAWKIAKSWEQENPNRFLFFFSILCTLTVDVLVYADIKSRIKYYNCKVDQCEKQTINIWVFLFLKCGNCWSFFSKWFHKD